MGNKGFTLIELIIVIAIIGILSAIAIPAYLGQQKNAARTEAYSNLQNLRLLEEQYYAERGCYYMDASNTCQNVASPGIPYKGTAADDGGIEDFLKGFKPGQKSSTNFSYSIVINNSGTGGGNASCFTATATGKAGTRVMGDTFTIDCNNNRNF
jgi:prepilin-type N-terminal cleavage/methylation domain-containing protein